MYSSIIRPYSLPPDCPFDPFLFAPRLLPGETVQGLMTADYIPPQIRTETLDKCSYNRMRLLQLL